MKKFLLIMGAVAMLFAGCKKSDPYVAVTGVKIDPTGLRITVGTTQALKAAVEPEDATNIEVEWSSDKPTIVSVDNAGRITALKSGEAYITVMTVDGGCKSRCHVVVTNKEVPVITVAEKKMVGEGDEIYLEATVEPSDLKITYISDRPDFATVDEMGRVHGVKTGIAIISLTTDATSEYEAASATCTVEVKNTNPQWVNVSANFRDETVRGGNNGKATLTAKYVNNTAYTVVEEGFTLNGTDYRSKSTGPSFSLDKTNLVPKTYQWCAYVILSDGKKYSSPEQTSYVEEGAPGHIGIDLGLPSGILWGSCNLGAENPYDIGQYFSWGEVAGYWTPSEKVVNSYKGFTIDTYDSSKAFADAATDAWGDGWRMPTLKELQELADTSNCTWEWVVGYNDSGVNGYLVTSRRVEDAFIFLPCTGVATDLDITDPEGRAAYWSSNKSTKDGSQAYYLKFTSDMYNATDTWPRCNGIAIRAVTKK